MLDSIHIALSGLQGHQRGLNLISNNVANLNTPGFKGSTLQFTDVYNADAGEGGIDGQGVRGGVDASQTSLDLRAGEAEQTGRDLDLMLEGSGYFVVEDERGEQRYTRSGSFEFNTDGVLVGRGHGLKVMARDANGTLVPISLASLRVGPPKATTQIDFTGNLSSTATEHAIDNVLVYDRLGGVHTLRLEFKPVGETSPGAWTVAVLEGGKALGTASLRFDLGAVASDSVKLSLSLPLGEAGGEASTVTLGFGNEVSGYSSGDTSTLSVKKQDGHAAGVISALRFDTSGVLQVSYTNGETVQGATLALAELRDDAGMHELGGGLYRYDGGEPATLRAAGEGLRVTGQSLELSNVDLTQEFSALILMQRGYQASSQVISTANEMLQELFDMKGGR